MKLFSISYIIFYSIIFILFVLSKDQWKKFLIAIASITFYALASIALLWYVIVILGLIYYINEKYYHHNFEKSVKPTIGIIVFLFFLFFFFLFKYDLFLGISFNVEATEISKFSKSLYPIGISYITFQAIGYILDLKYKKLNNKPDLIDRIIYLFFFPKVISGQ